jgi:uncharacterized DUF497 family protein
VQSERFEWDDQKAESNLSKHGVSFNKATAVFEDPFSVTFNDLDHSFGELREITYGSTLFNEVLVVSHTARGERIRIISARHADKAERRKFMNKKSDEIRDEASDDLRPHYDFDFSKGVRGKYYNPRHTVTTLMRIDNDILQHFSSAAEVNAALRTFIAEGRAPEPRNE